MTPPLSLRSDFSFFSFFFFSFFFLFTIGLKRKDSIGLWQISPPSSPVHLYRSAKNRFVIVFPRGRILFPFAFNPRPTPDKFVNHSPQRSQSLIKSSESPPIFLGFSLSPLSSLGPLTFSIPFAQLPLQFTIPRWDVQVRGVRLSTFCTASLLNSPLFRFRTREETENCVESLPSCFFSSTLVVV